MPQPALKRSLSLTLLVLYGLGTTIGAGIYVLVGKVAGTAGVYAPLAFVLAALVALPTALSFGELAARYPMSAGEAIYVQEAFGRPRLATLVGLAVVLVGIVSSAAISAGAVGYLAIWSHFPPGSAFCSWSACWRWWRSGASPSRSSSSRRPP